MKVRRETEFVRGKIYERRDTKEPYIYALVGHDGIQPIFRLISLETGNRYSDYNEELRESGVWFEVESVSGY